MALAQIFSTVQVILHLVGHKLIIHCCNIYIYIYIYMISFII